MKRKHNKKRNTAFLFEALVIELTKSLVENDTERTATIREMISEHFHKDTYLFRELRCYEALYPGQELDRPTAEKLVFLTKRRHEQLDSGSIFAEQTNVINQVNKRLGRHVFNNFVKEYKNYASLSQIFGKSLDLKSQVLLENTVVANLSRGADRVDSMLPVDSLVVKTFSENFNKKYDGLLQEQKSLLERYVVSLSQADQVEFRAYLGLEMQRLEEEVVESLTLEEVKNDPEMVSNTKKVLHEMRGISVSDISHGTLLKILKLQQLTSEYHK